MYLFDYSSIAFNEDESSYSRFRRRFCAYRTTIPASFLRVPDNVVPSLATAAAALVAKVPNSRPRSPLRRLPRMLPPLLVLLPAGAAFSSRNSSSCCCRPPSSPNVFSARTSTSSTLLLGSSLIDDWRSSASPSGAAASAGPNWRSAHRSRRLAAKNDSRSGRKNLGSLPADSALRLYMRQWNKRNQVFFFFFFFWMPGCWCLLPSFRYTADQGDHFEVTAWVHVTNSNTSFNWL